MKGRAEAEITAVVVIWNNQFQEVFYREIRERAKGQRVQKGTGVEVKGSPWRWERELQRSGTLS